MIRKASSKPRQPSRVNGANDTLHIASIGSVAVTRVGSLASLPLVRASSVVTISSASTDKPSVADRL